jgi:flagellum-specific peptidoglycan hydrolase FlgJ
MSEQEFIDKIASHAQTISDWTLKKALFFKKPIKNTIKPSLVLADIIIESNWGTHPIAQEFYNKKYSNNLSLIVADENWVGRVQKYAKVEYKSYKDWMTYTMDYSDSLIFSAKMNPIIHTDDQIKVLAATKSDPTIFAAKAEALIDFYSLIDYDN